ncbi:MAG TPA: DUF1439 domain-containing protein, partial [Burkholderiaceae bacterium]
MTTTLKSLRAAGVVLCALLLASCASLLGPRQVEIPLEKLQQSLDRRFPINHRLLEVFAIELSAPRLALLPDEDRLMLSMQASITPPFLRQRYSGNMALSGRLVIDAPRNAVVL